MNTDNNHFQQYIRMKNSDTIEVKVTSGSQFKYQFGLLQNLKGKLLTSIESFSNSEVPNSPTGNTVVDAAGFSRGFLTLVDKSGKEFITKLPLYSLSAKNNNGVLRLIDYLAVDWEKSFIEIGDQTTPAPTNQCYLFSVGVAERKDKAQLLYEQQRVKEELARIDKRQ